MLDLARCHLSVAHTESESTAVTGKTFIVTSSRDWEGVCALARALPRCTSLSELDLRGNHIDMAASKGARTLATYVGDSVSLRQLDGLDLRGHSAQVERGEQLSTCVIWLRVAVGILSH